MEPWLRLVYGEGYEKPRPQDAARLLPASTGDPYLACACADEPTLHRALHGDPELPNRPGGPLAMPPLVAVTFNSLVQLPEHAESLRRCCQRLLHAGADPNQTWIDPFSPSEPLSALYGAAGRTHDVEMTRILLEAGANPNDNESLYHSLETPDITITRMLLDAGARVSGTNAMARAMDFDHLDALRLLLARGGDPNDGNGFPLHNAIRRRRSLAHVEALLDAGADPSLLHGDRTSAYVRALLYGLTDVARRLETPSAREALTPQERFVAACAAVDRQNADPRILPTLSPEHLRQLPNLAAAGAADAVRFMVEIGWPIAVRGGDWTASALNYAVFRGDPALTGFLLDHGATWTEQHGYGSDVLGTLRYASCNHPVPGGDWSACANVLREHGAPVK